MRVGRSLGAAASASETDDPEPKGGAGQHPDIPAFDLLLAQEMNDHGTAKHCDYQSRNTCHPDDPRCCRREPVGNEADNAQQITNSDRALVDVRAEACRRTRWAWRARCP